MGKAVGNVGKKLRPWGNVWQTCRKTLEFKRLSRPKKYKAVLLNGVIKVEAWGEAEQVWFEQGQAAMSGVTRVSQQSPQEFYSEPKKHLQTHAPCINFNK